MLESIKCEGAGDHFFFGGKGVVHHEVVPRGQTVNGPFYLEVTKRLREADRRKRPEGWRNKTWMLHHDNAPAHTSLLIREFLAKHEMTVIPQLPYSLHLAPVDFFFPKLKSTLNGRRFQTIEELEENSLPDLSAMPQNAIQNWKKRWKRCIDSGGEFFEGDKSY
jgi:transposase